MGKRQEETHQQTEEQKGDSQGKEDEQVSAQMPQVQRDNQTDNRQRKIPPKGDNESRLRPANAIRTDEGTPNDGTVEVTTSNEGTEETRLISS